MSKSSRSKSTFSTSTILCLTILFLILVSHLTWIGWKIDNLSKISSSCLNNSINHDSRQSTTPLPLDQTTDTRIATGLRSVFQNFKAVVNKGKDKILKNDRDKSQTESEYIVNSARHEMIFNEDQLNLINKSPKPIRNLYISTFLSIHHNPNIPNPTIVCLPKDIKWETLHKTLKLSLTLKTPEVGIKLLAGLRPIDRYGMKHQFELFNLAAQFDDVYTASRVIASIRGYESPSRDSEANSQIGTIDKEGEIYWLAVSARFMSNLTPVS
ncbi:hypothetical protein V865_006799 [Kwoniella europaea PYCC6329]|uniref:SUN domain-containing protein n=1 Tax=Kwoniella europaea PYCC6329 TaxID=1423913 RepID=A0AAX4KQF5_9TREE